MLVSKKNFLIISCNPSDACIALEVELIRNYKNSACVSAINLNKLVGSFHPLEKITDLIFERIDNRYAKFIIPELNGEDLTPKIAPIKTYLTEIPITSDELRDYKIGTVSLGLSVLSSAASFSNCNSKLCSDYGEVIEKLWKIAHISYQVGVQLLAYDFDEIFIFNGRHAISRPISEILKLKPNLLVNYYEFDENRKGYFLDSDCLHLNETILKNINNHQIDEASGTMFFERNINNNGSDFTKKILKSQVNGYIPQQLLSKDYFVFFTSSPDEFFSITDKKEISNEFETQNDLAKFCAEECFKQGIVFVLRIHPHLRFKHKSWKSEWDFIDLERNGALILQPNDPCDSYSLLFNAKAIMTCGSTIGLEAAYHGVPCIEVGDTISAALKCGVHGTSLDVIRSFINKPFVLEFAKQQAIRYGSYFINPNSINISLLSSKGNCTTIDKKIISPVRCFVSKVKRIVWFFTKADKHML